MLLTQKKTFDLINSIDCHFLSQVKTNCPKLWAAVAAHCAVCQPISTHEYYDSGHGRQVYRRIVLYGALTNSPAGWNGIQRVTKVQRRGHRQGKQFDETAYYVMSIPLNCAEKVAKGIQSHWGIENKLHWAKDVNMGEDAMTLRRHEQVSMLVHLNNIAYNTLNINGYKVVKDTFARFANKVKELCFLFRSETKT